MSAIFGIFHLDGKPVSQEALGDMQNAMDYWGPDGSGIWREGNVGLGHLLMHNTPESLHEKLPMIDSLGGWRSHGLQGYFATAASAYRDSNRRKSQYPAILVSGDSLPDTFFRVDENQEKMRFYDSGSAKPVHGSCANPLDLMK